MSLIKDKLDVLHRLPLRLRSNEADFHSRHDPENNHSALEGHTKKDQARNFGHRGLALMNGDDVFLAFSINYGSVTRASPCPDGKTSAKSVFISDA